MPVCLALIAFSGSLWEDPLWRRVHLPKSRFLKGWRRVLMSHMLQNKNGESNPSGASDFHPRRKSGTYGFQQSFASTRISNPLTLLPFHYPLPTVPSSLLIQSIMIIPSCNHLRLLYLLFLISCLARWQLLLNPYLIPLPCSSLWLKEKAQPCCQVVP